MLRELQELVRQLWKTSIFWVGVVFVGAAVCAGLDPERAVAGCALIFVAKSL